MNERAQPRIAVIGHVEHVTLAPVGALPQAGEIVHLDGVRVLPGGGGGIAFYQLTRAATAELHLFTALGHDDAATAVELRLAQTAATLHVARRDEPHTRDIVLVTPGGERTIVVVGEPLHPKRDDDLPWDMLASCDAAYFTAQDPRAIEAARAAGLLMVTARRASALASSGVKADVVVGSVRDPREAATLADFATPPELLVMTDGAIGGHIETRHGVERFSAPEVTMRGSYGAGDSFAAALLWYLVQGSSPAEACAHAAEHGAAVVQGIDPLEHQTALE